ncbi:MAG TPA: Rid family hydrolase [Rhizomicrobium sp.]|nr:Rid family hydrolase [Rhizomicrobium sp.]
MNIRTLILASAIALAGLVPAAQAQEINRVVANPNALFSSVVAVPPGYTLYFVSGALPTPVAPPANGQPANWGDSTQQTQSVMNNLKASMAKAGLTFGDVVKATAFMGPDLDFQAMNKVWQTEFGTAAQPNKPARAAFHVQALAAPGAQLEIEFIAAKKESRRGSFASWVRRTCSRAMRTLRAILLPKAQNSSRRANFKRRIFAGPPFS